MNSIEVSVKQKIYHPTKYWSRANAGKVQCDLCPRLCKLADGQRGLCFVRMAHDGEVVLTSYGRSSGFVIDPIEKKPLNHFLPGSAILSFGTAGCNLTCSFCQNWDMSKARAMDRLQDEAQPESIARAAKDNGCGSVAFTYNDPVIFLEYAVDVAKACKKAGIRSVAVTAGYIHDEAREEFFQHMDAANIDLKGFSENFYRKLCGGHLQTILDTLVYLKQNTSVWFELTTLLIPGKNDSNEELDAMTKWVVDNLGSEVPLHFTAFHPDYKMTDLPPTSIDILHRAQDIARGNGVRYVYTGNVRDKQGSSTYCHNCGNMLIGRSGYTLSDWRLTDNGACNECGEVCAGTFADKAGTWGSRFVRVNMVKYRN